MAMRTTSTKISATHGYPTMHLTAREILKLRQWTRDCYNNKRQHNITDRKHTTRMTPTGIILMGKAGEQIAANYYGTTIDWDIYIGPDHGHDIQIHGNTTEIKTSTHRQLILNDPKHEQYGIWKPTTKQCLLIWCGQHPTQLDNIGTNTPFQILGYTTHQHFTQHATHKDFSPHNAPNTKTPRLVLQEHQLLHLPK